MARGASGFGLHEPAPANLPVTPAMATLSKLQSQMRAKLDGARFRWINQDLYTRTGAESFAAMQEDPTLFTAYHEGYRKQVAQWPLNPLDVIIAEVARSPRTAVVADMGCGEARLAASVPHTVHSFDLVAANKGVVACDIAHVPLPSASVDIVVFCLSLMGTNYMDFLREARRVLKPGGRLLVAEVSSRLEGGDVEGHGGGGGGEGGSARPPVVGAKRKRPDDGGMSAGVAAFVSVVQSLGFRVQHHDCTNPLFVLMYFRKVGSRVDGGDGTEVRGADGVVAAAEEAAATLSKSARRRRNKKMRAAGGAGATDSDATAHAVGVDATPTQPAPTVSPAADASTHIRRQAGRVGGWDKGSTGGAGTLKPCLYKRR